MRHDPASGAIVIMPRSQSLISSTKGRLPLTYEEDRFAGDWVPILAQLLKAELAERKDRSIACHMKAAHFPKTVARSTRP